MPDPKRHRRKAIDYAAERMSDRELSKGDIEENRENSSLKVYRGNKYQKR